MSAKQRTVAEWEHTYLNHSFVSPYFFPVELLAKINSNLEEPLDLASINWPPSHVWIFGSKKVTLYTWLSYGCMQAITLLQDPVSTWQQSWRQQVVWPSSKTSGVHAFKIIRLTYKSSNFYFLVSLRCQEGSTETQTRWCKVNECKITETETITCELFAGTTRITINLKNRFAYKTNLFLIGKNTY